MITIEEITKNEIDTDQARERVADGKSVFMVRYLDYSDAPFHVRKRGYGYGRDERIYRTRDDAKEVFDGLVESGWIEDIEMFEIRASRHGGTHQAPVDEWKDPRSTMGSEENPPNDRKARATAARLARGLS